MKEKPNPKNFSMVTGTTMGTTLNTSAISQISEISHIREEMGDETFELDPNQSGLYNRPSLNPFGSILMTKKHQVIHFECPPNFRKLYYDDAVAELKMFCETTDMKVIESLKFHTNSWGLSSCNWFAENVVANMVNI